jgi:2',3'-cyclic-nucleotide 2'-phosphodiesterase (5'-nucleotidase family)
MKKRFILATIILFVIGLTACVTVPTPITQEDPPYFLEVEDIIYYIGDELPDYLDGVIARNHQDQDISQFITFDDSNVDLDSPGSYMLFYSVEDENGQKTTIYIYVVVLPEIVEEIDIFAPILYGLNDIHHYINHQIPDLLDGVSAIDDVDGNITHLIEIDASSVDFYEVGTYVVTFTVSDQAGNITVDSINVHISIENIDYLNIYYINDVHGAILEEGNNIGMAKMASVILEEKTNNPNNTLFISGGDILQGNILSNHSYGASFIDILNHMQHDAFVIGNHEFDWGLEVVTEYFNPATEGVKANFPLLGANVFYKGTKNIPDFIDPYVIIEKGNIKVGVIGLMGYGLESSIATARVRDYEFGDPLVEVEYYTRHLRTEKNVDIVLVVIHGSDNLFNQQVGALTGDQRVDAVFNGHTHQTYVNFIGRTGVDMPVMQSGGNGTHLGNIKFLIDNQKITSYVGINLNQFNEARMTIEHPDIKSIINAYVSGISSLLYDPIIYAGQYLSRDNLTYYMAKLMRLSTNSDIAFHNRGGTRADIQNNEAITVATLYKVFPFDNRIKTVTLKGEDIIEYMDRYGFYSLREGLDEIDPNLYYKVATNDYLFDIETAPFLYGTDIEDTGIYIRDLLQDVLEEIAKSYQAFTFDIPVPLTQQNHTIDDNLHILSTSAIRERFLIAFSLFKQNISVYITQSK